MCDCFLQTVGNLSEITVALTALIGAIYAGWQYKNMLKRDKFEAISNLNNRFTSNETLCKVTKWLTNKDSVEQAEQDQIEPTLYDYEIYCRFGEELEIGIEQGYLNPKDVKSLFWYYINEAKDKLIDYKDGNNWVTLNKFIERMNNIE